MRLYVRSVVGGLLMVRLYEADALKFTFHMRALISALPANSLLADEVSADVSFASRSMVTSTMCSAGMVGIDRKGTEIATFTSCVGLLAAETALVGSNVGFGVAFLLLKST